MTLVLGGVTLVAKRKFDVLIMFLRRYLSYCGVVDCKSIRQSWR